MSFINALSHAGNTAYVWSGSVGSNIDVTSIDPKKTTSNRPGRRCIGIYVGSAGNLVVETPNCDGYAGSTGHMYYAGLPAGTFLDVVATKVLASGLVKDSATGTLSAKTSTAKDLVIYWGV
jgi:hypothetical protein